MKKTIILLSILFMSTPTLHANQESIKSDFTVTQVALDAANDKAAEEVEEQEDKNCSTEETQLEGGATEEK
jgi:hypothetical protein